MTYNESDNQAPRRLHRDPNLRPAIGVMVLMVLTMPVMLAVVRFSSSAPPVTPLQAAADHYGLDVTTYATGRATFTTACVVCHGNAGQGVPALGRPLKNSEFVQGCTDEQLIALVTHGRLPTDPASASGVLMPARGANPAVTDEVIPMLVSFLRTMQREGEPFTDASAWDVSLEDRQAAAAEAEASAAASGIVLSGPGFDAFVAGCSACHGPQGEGMEGLGKPFVGSEFIGSKSDKELMTFIKMGRPIWDADNTTGIDMPPKGGNPAISDDELMAIIGFIRSVHGSSSE